MGFPLSLLDLFGVFDGSAQSAAQVGAADLLLVIADRHGVGVERADEVDLLACAGDAGVDEVAL